MTTIKNAKQIAEERKRLHQREEELKEKIRANWSELTGDTLTGSKHSYLKENGTVGEHSEESVLVNTLSYAGALLGHRLGIRLERRIKQFLSDKE